MLWCGPDAANGVGLFLKKDNITFRKIDAGVNTGAFHDFGYDILPGTVFKIGYRKTSAQMELYINGVLMDTNATASAGSSATIGTYFELDASNCSIKELDLYNEV